MGIGTILDASETVLLAVGENKADAIRQAVDGPVSSRLSASAFQFHNTCRMVLDAAAASGLENPACYDFLARNQPKWDVYSAFLS